MPGHRLSEYILLGDMLRIRDGRIFYSSDQNCGCAIGGAMLAVGRWMRGIPHDHLQRFGEWPWLGKTYPGRGTFSAAIGTEFDRVCRGEMTLEALAQQVQVWEDEYDENLREPATDEPAVATEIEERKESLI
jgi:hypothetical protein